MYEDKHAALREAALSVRGDTSRDLREQVYEAVEARTRGEDAQGRRGEAPPPLVAFLDRLGGRAAELGDPDIQALRDAGFSDDALFELTITGSVAAGLTRYALAMQALKESA